MSVCNERQCALRFWLQVLANQQVQGLAARLVLFRGFHWWAHLLLLVQVKLKAENEKQK